MNGRTKGIVKDVLIIRNCWIFKELNKKLQNVIDSFREKKDKKSDKIENISW
jgi:hypothetical protein